MGRGRQKAKQTKMARKLKYLTTDTDYDELEKELSSEITSTADEPKNAFSEVARETRHQQELDDYAKWAAEAAAKAQEQKPAVPKKPIHMPIPRGLKSILKPAAKSDDNSTTE